MSHLQLQIPSMQTAAAGARGSGKSASPLAAAWMQEAGRSQRRRWRIRISRVCVSFTSKTVVYMETKITKRLSLSQNGNSPSQPKHLIRQPTLQPKHSAGRIVTATSLRFVLSNKSKLRTGYRPTPPYRVRMRVHSMLIFLLGIITSK